MDLEEKIHETARRDKVSVSFVFKEYVHRTVLDFLFQKGLFRYWVFQGGTAIRIVYGGVRYSEDLDFVLRKKSASVFSGIPKQLNSLASYVRRALPVVNESGLTAQKETATFRRFTLVLKTDILAASDKTNIKIANVPSYRHQTKIIAPADTGLAPAVCVETPEEILADKLVAFGAREYIKGRDLWDINYLMNTLNVSADKTVMSLVQKKIRDYGIKKGDQTAGLKQRTALLKKEGPRLLHNEMNRFLPESYRRSFESQYDRICAEEALMFEQLRDRLQS